ncbi:MAG: LamG domain-containing protein [Thermofilum sp.]
MPLARTRLLPVARAGLRFNGVNQYVRVADTLGIPASSSFTFEVLAFLRQAVTGQNQYFIAKHYRAAIRGHYMGIPNLGMIWLYSDGTMSEWNSGRNIVNLWSHLAMVYDSSAQKMYLYLNGTEISGGRPIAKPLSEGLDYYVGAWTYGYGFIPATISVARIYSRALSSEEILWNYYYPDNPVRNGLVLWLHYDTIDTANNKWYDKSGFGNHATLYNGPVKEDVVLPPKRSLSPTRTLSPVR